MSIKHQFTDMADTEIQFNRIETHPELGRIRLGHLPLWAIEEIFPETLDELRRYTSFALCRDPFDRFESAISQHLQQHRKKRINDFSRRAVLETTQQIIEEVRRTPRLVSADYCHFIRQSDFIFLRGVQVVDSVYPLSRIGALAKALSKATGINATPELHANQTLDFRIQGSEQHLRWFSGLSRAVLPRRLHAYAKRIGKSALVRGGSRHEGFARDEPAIASFIKDYYKEDVRLHGKALDLGVLRHGQEGDAQQA